MTPIPDPLREAAQALLDWYDGPPFVYEESDMETRLRALRAALAQPAPALDVERLTAAAARLAPFLAIEFGKAGFFAATASMEFLHAQAMMMLADAVADALAEPQP